MTKKDVPFGPYKSTVQLLSFLKRIQIRRTYLFLSITLAAFAGLFRLVELRFILIFLRGIINRDFSFLATGRIARYLAPLFPGVFTSYVAMFILVASSVFILTLIISMLSYASSVSMQRQMQIADSNLRSLIFSRLLQFGKLFFDRRGFPNLQMVLINNSRAVTKQLEALHQMLSKVFMLVAYTAILFFISWQLALFTLFIFLSMTCFSSLFMKKMRDLSRVEWIARKSLDEKIFYILSCIPLVKAYSREEEEKQYFKEVSDEEVEIEYGIMKNTQLTNQFQDISAIVAILFVAVAMAFVFPSGGAADASRYILFFIIVRMMTPCFTAIGEFMISLARASESIVRVTNIIENDERKCIIPEGRKEFPGLRKSIDFCNLNFSYKPKLPVLKEVSFSLEKGKKTAIVGSTGSGKSTLAHILLRFYDCKPGSILIDGVDIREYTFKSLRSHIAIVSQDVLLFNDTLRENIAYGLDDVEDTAVIEATKKACLHDFIMRLPEQYETMIGDRGAQLSGGEKQRASISRAFLKSADILILDEASSALDVRTERLIQEAINDTTQEKTLIIIAHRLSTIKQADHIVVLHEGMVVEQGSFRELLRKKGELYAFWQEQRLDDILEEESVPFSRGPRKQVPVAIRETLIN